MNFHNESRYEKLFFTVAQQCFDKNDMALRCLDKPS